MKKIMSIFMSSTLIVGTLVSCTSANTEAIVKKSDFKFTVDPETF